MNKINLLQYAGNFYKKSLEIYIDKLKRSVSKHLEKNELEKVKEIIKNIDGIRKLEKEIDGTLIKYFKDFPDEKSLLNPKPTSDETKGYFIHYTSEILDIISSEKEIQVLNLKSQLYDEIISHISSEEISNNEKNPNMLNWEVYFYKSLSFLLSKGYVHLNEAYLLILTDKGQDYQGEDIDTEIEYFDDDSIYENEITSDFLENNADVDLLVSIRSHLMSSLVEEGILSDSDDPFYYKTTFYIIKSIFSIDGFEVSSWEQIKLNNFYKIETYSEDDKQTVLVQQKYDGFHVVKCIDDNNYTSYYAFL